MNAAKNNSELLYIDAKPQNRSSSQQHLAPSTVDNEQDLKQNQRTYTFKSYGDFSIEMNDDVRELFEQRGIRFQSQELQQDGSQMVNFKIDPVPRSDSKRSILLHDRR